MKPLKRPLSRAEKSLFAIPLFMLGAGLWLGARRSVTPKVMTSAHIMALPGLASEEGFSFSPDGKKFVLHRYPHWVGIFDSATLNELCKLESPDTYLEGASLEWSPDGRQLVGRFGNSLQSRFGLWDAATGKILRRWDDKHQVSSFSSNPSWIGRVGNAKINFAQDKLAIASADLYHVKVVDYHSRRILMQIKAEQVSSFAWTASDVLGILDDAGPIHSITANCGRLTLWDGRTRKFLPPPPETEPIFGFSLNEKAPLVAALQLTNLGDPDKLPVRPLSKIMVWDYGAQKVRWRDEVEINFPKSDWSPDGNWLAVRGEVKGHCEVSIFDANGTLCCRGAFPSYSNLFWSPDSKRLAILGNGKLGVVEAKSWQ